MITGFVFGGESRQFLIRLAGPALVPFGVQDALLDPKLTIYDASATPVLSADNWDTNQGDAIADAAGLVGAFPFEPASADAALLVDLPPGAYTVVSGSQQGDEGIALAEVYEMPGQPKEGEWANVSVRARVESGQRVAIPGFVTAGESNPRYLIRAVGPGLAGLGVSSLQRVLDPFDDDDAVDTDVVEVAGLSLQTRFGASLEDRSDRIGLVAFAGRAYIASPMTLDHAFLQENLARLSMNTIEDGTAIGSGLSGCRR